MTAPPPGDDETYYHRSLMLYEHGDRILPGAWGRLVRGAGVGGHPHFLRECLWEFIRTERYPDRPSRLDSAFVSLTMEAALNMRGRERTGPPELIYEVRPAGAADRTFRADMTWIERQRECRTVVGAVECVERYWRGDVFDEEQIEVLVRGELVVLRRATQIGEDLLKAPPRP